MPHWQALSKIDHAQAGWTRFTDYQHAQHDALAPVMAIEIPNLLPSYALGFSQTPASYQLVAILSLQAGLNLFLDSRHQWQAAYVPAHYRSHPFNLLPNQKGEPTLCFDTDAGLIHTPAEEHQLPLLDDQGQPSEHLAPIIQFLQQCHQQRQVTQTLVNQLSDHHLIQPWPLNSAGADGEAKPVKGLYRIDEAALKALDPSALSQLAQSGALAIAYGQLLSQTRLPELSTRFERQLSQPSTDDINLDSLFGDGDDSLTFNFH